MTEEGESKPSRHIDRAIEAIDRLFPIENENGKLCWRCAAVPKEGGKSGLCVKCIKGLKEADDDTA